MTARSYDLDDMVCAVIDLRLCLTAVDDILHRTPRVRNGVRDEDLDIVSTLVRMAISHAEQTIEAAEETER